MKLKNLLLIFFLSIVSLSIAQDPTYTHGSKVKIAVVNELTPVPPVFKIAVFDPNDNEIKFINSDDLTTDITASNGLTLSNGNIVLGGALNANTSITIPNNTRIDFGGENSNAEFTLNNQTVNNTQGFTLSSNTRGQVNARGLFLISNDADMSIETNSAAKLMITPQQIQGTDGQVLTAQSDGSVLWETPTAGTDYSEWATFTGTRAGGDLVVTIGDYDDSDLESKFIVDVGNEVIQTNVSIEAPNYRAGNNTNNSTIRTVTGITGTHTFDLPNVSGTPIMSVNGNTPGIDGAITISTGGSPETDVFRIPASDFNWTAVPTNYANSTLSIRHDFDVSNGTINLPENVTLQFDGGSISNATINFNDTRIEGPSQTSFSSVTLGTGNIINNYVDATWFGIVGDDSTDNSATLNALTTFLTNNNGGTVYFPNGTYRMADVQIRGNVSFIGQSWGTVISAASNPTNGILNITNPEARIFNLRVNGRDVANVGVRIYNNNGQGSVLQHLSIQNCNTYALEIDDTNNITVKECTFNDKVYCNGGDSAHFADNTFEGFTDTYALKVETTSASQTASSALIESNWFEATTSAGFTSAIEANGNAIYIVNNHFHLPYTGTTQAVLVGASADYTNIVGNNFQTVENDRVINILSGSNYTLVKENRGVVNTDNYLANGDRVLIDLGDIRNVNQLSYRPLGQNVDRLILNVADEKIQYGDNANNFIEKDGANLLINSATRTNIYTNGNNISMQASGTNGAIYMNSPMRFRSLALSSFPAASNYLRGVGIYDFTNHDMYINNSTEWVRQLNETDLSNISSTFTTNDGKTATVTNGIVTGLTAATTETRHAKVSITSAELLALNTTAKELVAAPGVGKVIIVESIAYRYNFNTSAYTTVQSLNFTQGGSVLAQISSPELSATASYMKYKPVVTQGTPTNQITENVSLQIQAGSEVTAGDGTMDIYLTYKIVTL